MWLKLRTKYDFDNKNMEKTMWKTQDISHIFTCFLQIYPCLIYRLSCCIYRSNRSCFWSGLDALQLGHDVLGCGHPGLVVSLEKRRFIDLDGKPPSKNNITMENQPFQSMHLLIIYIYIFLYIWWFSIQPCEFSVVYPLQNLLHKTWGEFSPLLGVATLRWVVIVTPNGGDCHVTR